MSMILFLALQASPMLDLSSFPVDQERLVAELAADQDVIQSLRSNGDIASIVRPLDVQFLGNRSALRKLAKDLKDTGWTIVRVSKVAGVEYALDVQRKQTTDIEAIQVLTETALKIEAKYSVRYDGWGCVAQTGIVK